MTTYDDYRAEGYSHEEAFKQLVRDGEVAASLKADFLWNEDASHEEVVAGYQELINSGQAWKLEGHVGRTAMGLIESGECTLGETGHTDYWGNYVPSRHEVEPGTKGSPEYAAARKEE